jgi:thymidylate kinase
MDFKKLILEGVDGSGKTTYIQNFITLHSGFKKVDFDFLSHKEAVGDWEARLLAKRFYVEHLEDDEPEVFDRSQISNYIYAKISGRYHQSALNMLLRDVLTIKPNGVKIIFLMPDLEIIKERLIDHSHKIEWSKVELAYNEYLEIIEKIKNETGLNYEVITHQD